MRDALDRSPALIERRLTEPSLLVTYAFAQLGVHLPRVAADQFRAGEGVRIDSLSTPYFAAQYAGARRCAG